MKVLMISADKKIFAPESRVRQRQISYGSVCNELHIIIPADASFPAEEQIADNVWLYSTQNRGKLAGWLALIRRGLKVVKERGLAAKGSLVTTQDPFELGLSGWLVARLGKLPLNLQLHGDISSPYFRGQSLRRRLQFWLAHRLIPRAETVRVVSRRVADYLAGWKKEGVYSLPIYTDKEEVENQANTFEPSLPFTNTAIIVARLEHPKGVGFAIRALADTLKQRDDFGLLILGDGSLRAEIKQLIAELGLEEKVELAGWVDNPLPFMKQAKMTLVPSYYEGWGMVAVESLLVGTPVIMTDVGCARELVRDETGGVVVPVADAEALAVAVADLLQNDARRQKLAEKTQAVGGRINSHAAYLKELKHIWQQTIRNY